MTMPSTTTHANHSRPTTTVVRSRLRSATEEPPTDDCMPPPNMSERPPPLPLCISTSSIISRLKTIRAIENPKTTAGPTLSDSDDDGGTATAVPPQGYDVSPLPHTPSSCHWSRKRTILTTSSASSEAPPTRAPSMSAWAMISATLPDFTEPPYWMRTLSASSWVYSSASLPRMAAQTSWASSEPQTLPVPMAHTGS